MSEVNVLLVEDEDDLRMVIGEALRMMGYRVTPAADGPQAVDAMEHGRFEIVVSDVNMPGGMSGIELAEHVRQLQPRARIILVSGFARAQLPSLPAHITFLPKPYRIPQLLELLRSHTPPGDDPLAHVPG